MIVHIRPVKDHTKYTVNGHMVYKNEFKNWSCSIDLSATEINAFLLYEKIIINNSRIRKHINATYRN
ncbi:hypothetical protein [Flavobacterium lipolyticum]|uniref:Uncharacterized protein n=1 Tax=Flavobacterium lipolyticum TaxID=2893754 RepID=A0ABS8M411_9FLAO|nr:hypothetical protein [Flavobacterium sp. F-126]MCC9019559.1 hypothetical protein [Flavobacterium sp. F-126]